MEQKLKPCAECKLPSKLWAKKMCKSCYFKLFPPKELKRSPIKPKQGYTIPKQSRNQKDRTKKYLELRDIYLKEHPLCEVCQQQKATDIHHKAGRVGENLFQHFLAVDRECHRRIEENPEWAKENNYSITRL